MIKNVTALGRGGLHDWLIQRISALVITVFVLHMVLFFCIMPEVSYQDWVFEFHQPWVRILTTMFLLSLACHAWIGMWTVFTDYLKETRVRLFLQFLMIICLVTYVIWGISIVWGVQ